MKKLRVRIPIYLIGLFLMTIGIALSVKSDLGVSPVSSIPYTMTCVWGIEMGKATILFHIGLVVLQLLILRADFRLINLLQVPIGVIFGYYTTFSNYLFSLLPDTQNLVFRFGMMALSAFLIAFGIFLYLPADLPPLAGEGAMQTLAQVSGIEIAKVKIAFDCSMVGISALVCVWMLHSLGSVGLGTVLAAVLVGFFLGLLTRTLGAQRDRLYGVTAEPADEENE